MRAQVYTIYSILTIVFLILIIVTGASCQIQFLENASSSRPDNQFYLIFRALLNSLVTSYGC